MTFLLVGCRQSLPAAPISVGEQMVSTPPHAAFATVPAELGDAGALERIRHRVRVRWMNRASPTHGAPMEPILTHTPSNVDVDRILPVIGESATEIRVVVEDDDARLALWIDRHDAWPTVLVPIQLADREGRVPKQTGAFLDTGAPIDVAFGRDRVRHVTLRDDDVAVEGWVPAEAIGNVWIAPPGDRTATHVASYFTSSYTPPSDRRPKTRFASHATLRAAPDDTAPIVGVVLGADVIGFVDNARGAWTEVEVPRDHARLRGFVRAAALRPAGDELIGHGSGTGSGFGISDTARIVVPAGTCLFDRASGEVAGVQLAESERYGERDVEGDGWSRVYVDSPWAVLGFFVHDTGSDPKQPVWESCANRH